MATLKPAPKLSMHSSEELVGFRWAPPRAGPPRLGRSANATVIALLADWAERYNGEKPGTTMAPLGYDAAMLMMAAMKVCEDVDNPQSIIDAIENTVDFPGVSGLITLKGMGGDPRKRAIMVKVTATGQSFAKAYEYEDIFGQDESSDDTEESQD